MGTLYYFVVVAGYFFFEVEDFREALPLPCLGVADDFLPRPPLRCSSLSECGSPLCGAELRGISGSSSTRSKSMSFFIISTPLTRMLTGMLSLS